MQHSSKDFVLPTAAEHIHFLSKKSNQYLIAFLFCVRCLKFTSSTWQGLSSGQKHSSLQSDNLKYLDRTVIIMQTRFTKTSYFKWTQNILIKQKTSSTNIVQHWILPECCSVDNLQNESVCMASVLLQKSPVFVRLLRLTKAMTSNYNSNPSNSLVINKTHIVAEGVRWGRGRGATFPLMDTCFENRIGL